MLPEIPGYEILEPLGKGGMGSVFRALKKENNQIVALKVLRESPDTPYLDRVRFQREFRIAQEVHHPVLVNAFEYGEAGSLLYYTMELVSGTDLVTYLGQQKRYMPPATWLQQLIGLFSALLSALDAVHSHGIIHRDLKPGNILVDIRGTPRLLDFGLARQAGVAGLTQTGVIVGTADYMAPEHMKGELLDARADLYSVGVILYEVLSGNPPFANADTARMIIEVLQKDPEPLQPGERCPQPLIDIVVKLLSKKREDRYSSAGEVKAALAELLPPAAKSEDEEVRVMQAQGLLEPHFVGRENELKELVDLARGGTNIIMLEGPIGIGRTRFLQEAAKRLDRAGFDVVVSACLEQGGQPGHPLRPALQEALKAGLPNDLTFFRSALGTVVADPKLRGNSKSVHKLHLLEGVRQVLLHYASKRKVAILIDDMQWADRSTVDSLEHLTRMPTPGLTLVLAHCAEAGGGHSRSRLDSQRRVWKQKQNAIIELPPLNREEMRSMIRTMLGFGAVSLDVVEDFWQETGGRPLLVSETLKALASDGKVRRTGGSWDIEIGPPLPKEEAKLGLSRRLVGISEHELNVAQILALMGRSSLTQLFRAVGGASEEFISSLESLRLRRILTEDQGGLWDFESRLMRQTVRHTLTPQKAVSLHKQLAELLEEQGAAPERLAWHWQEAQDAGKAAQYLVKAAEQHQRAGGALKAATLYHQAMLLDPELKEKISENLADAYRVGGELSKALGIYQTLLKTQDRPSHWMRKVADCHHDLGHLDDAHELYVKLLEEQKMALPSQFRLPSKQTATRLFRKMMGKRQNSQEWQSPLELGKVLERLQRVLLWLQPPGWDHDVLEIRLRLSELAERLESALPQQAFEDAFWGLFYLFRPLPDFRTNQDRLFQARAGISKALDEFKAAPDSPERDTQLHDLAYFLLISGEPAGISVMENSLDNARKLGEWSLLPAWYAALSVFEGLHDRPGRAQQMVAEAAILSMNSRNQTDLTLLHIARAHLEACAGKPGLARKSLPHQAPPKGLLRILFHLAEVQTLVAENKDASKYAETALNESWARQNANEWFASTLGARAGLKRYLQGTPS